MKTNLLFRHFAFIISIHFSTITVYGQSSTSNAIATQYGFIENKGQIMNQDYFPNNDVKFLFCGGEINTQLRNNGFSYELRQTEKSSELLRVMQEPTSSTTDMKKMRELDLQTIVKTHRIDVDILNSNPNTQLIAEQPAADYINYYTQITTEQGAVHVRHYNKVTYKNIYNNIDLVFEINNQSELKYNFIIYPGGNPSEIKMQYNGAYDISLADNQIIIKNSIRTISENIPLSYQYTTVTDNKEIVQVKFHQFNDNTFGFISETYSPEKTLVIDPVPNIMWGTYYASTGGDYGMGVTLDNNGNSIACGDARSATNIATSGAFQTVYAGGGDVFMVKFNAAGARQWATYYGGSGWDGATAIVSDATGNVYITAWITGNGIFATVGAHQSTYGGGPWDALAAKFDANGARVWSTYYGGSMDDEGWGICVDASGNILVTGNTESSNNISSVGAHQVIYGGGSDDAFLVKFDANGNRLWGTYYGGTGTETDWYKSGITTDNNNNVVLATWSNSVNTANNIATVGAYQTTLNGPSDAILVKFNAAGVRQWATYYGGASADVAYGVVCDVQNNIVFVGRTNSPTNISTVGTHQTTLSGSEDAFAVKFSATGTRIWGSYFGGTGTEQAYNIDNICNQLLVMGYTTSASAIAFGSNLHQANFGGTQDAFISLFDQSTGTIVWSTYYGGTGTESAYWYESNVSSNNSGDFVILGNTTSTNNIFYNTGHQNSLVGFTSPFIARFIGSAPFSLTPNINNVVCFNGNSGSSTITPTGGTSPYTYLWSNSQTTQTATGLSSGTYTVTVTDANGCTSQQTITITQPAALSVSTNNTSINCNGGNATASVTVTGGTSPYTYLWSNSQTTQTATGLSSGTYTVTVTDANGCTSQQTITITQPTALTISMSSTVANCSMPNGTATATVNGGNGPYTYLWSPSLQTTVTATALSSGTYTVIVTDANGCSVTAQVVVNATNGVTLTTTQTNLLCFGDLSGTVTANPANGQNPYTYIWSNGQTTQTATGLSAGTYSVVVTDANGCSVNQTVTITQPVSLSTTINSTNVLCNGGNNATATVAVGGGTAPYTYLWSNGQTAQTSTGLTAGNYTVTVTDANGCTSQQTINVTAPAAISLIITNTSILCNGGNASASAVVTGGTSPYTYLWSNGQTTQTANGLLAGNYTVTVTDANGCTSQQTIILAQPTVITLNTSNTNVFCNGGNDGTAAVTVTGGSSPYTYMWSTGQTTQSASSLIAGNYTIVVTDANGCTILQTVTVTQPAPINVTSNTAPAICSAPTGTATVTATNGTAPYQYNWANGQTTQTATGLAYGTYAVVITDANGCTVQQTVTVTQTSPPVASASASTPQLMYGEQTLLNASGGVTYSWYPSVNLSCSNCSTLTAQPKETTSYCVVVTDANGCTDEACVTLEVNYDCGQQLLQTLLPNAFSPNGDAVNNQYCVPANPCISNFSIIVYDRLGEKVFESTTFDNCWDGYFKGKHLNTGVFVYFFKAELINGQSFSQKGNISLIR